MTGTTGTAAALRPLHYERAAVGLKFGRLVRRLAADFGASCESERDTQNSSEYGRVHVPADATVYGTRIVVCVNKFGSLAEVCADKPGAFLGTDEAHEEGRWTSATSPSWSGRWPTSAT